VKCAAISYTNTDGFFLSTAFLSFISRGSPFAETKRAIQGGALNRGLFFADPPPSLLGAVSGKISKIR
jgi:hypothetical protein